MMRPPTVFSGILFIMTLALSEWVADDHIQKLEEISEGPVSSMLPYYLVAALGAVIAVLGIRTALQGRPEVGVSAMRTGGTGVTFSQISQGVVIAIVGTATTTGSLYVSQRSTTKTATQTTQDSGESSTTEVFTRDLERRAGSRLLGRWGATAERGTRMEMHSIRRWTASLPGSGIDLTMSWSGEDIR